MIQMHLLYLYRIKPPLEWVRFNGTTPSNAVQLGIHGIVGQAPQNECACKSISGKIGRYLMANKTCYLAGGGHEYLAQSFSILVQNYTDKPNSRIQLLPFKGDIPQKAFVAGTGSMADEGMEDQGLVSTQKIYIGIFSYSDGDYTGRIYPRGYSFTAGGKIISTIYPTYILCTK